MTVFYGTQMTKIDSVAATPGVGFVHGNVRCFAETVTYATQTTSDTIEVGLLPKGAVFLFGLITTSVSTGSATLAIGITGTTGKYFTAAAYTTVDVPLLFGKTPAVNAAEAADRTVFITIAAASLPGSGTLNVTLVYALD